MDKQIRNIVDNGGFIRWDEDQNHNYQWSKLFALKPLFKDQAGRIKVVGLLTGINWHKPKPKIDSFSDAKAYRDELERKCFQWHERIDEIDKRIISVIKQWYAGAIENGTDKEALDSCTKALFKELREGRTGNIENLVYQHISNINTPDVYRQSLVNGVTKLYNEKRPLYDELSSLLEKWHAWRKAIHGYHNRKNIGNQKLPDTYEVAKEFVERKENKNSDYKADEIEPVMKVARDYIIREEIETTYGCLNTIVREAGELINCDPKTRGNWVKFYAEKAGLKTTK